MVILARKPYQLFSGQDFERPLNGKVSIFQLYVAINCSFYRDSALHKMCLCCPPTTVQQLHLSVSLTPEIPTSYLAIE